MTTWNDVLALGKASTRASGQCLGLVLNDITAKLGHLAKTYGTAAEARAAAIAAGQYHAGLPPTNRVVYVWYDYPVDEHIGLAYGSEVMYDSTQCTSFLNAKRTVGVAPITHYSYKLLGWAENIGPNVLPQIPTPNVNPYGNAGVQVGKAAANRRATPTTSAKVDSLLAAGAWFESNGYTDEGQAVSGNTRWFRDEAGGWLSATVATAHAPTALARLKPDGTPWTAPGVVTKPPAPVTHTVTFDWNDDDGSITEQVEDGKPIAAPSIPTRSAFTFSHWATDSAGVKPYDLTAAIVADVTLYAAWTAVAVLPEPPKDDTPPSTTVSGGGSPSKSTTKSAAASGFTLGGILAVVLTFIEGVFASLH